MIRAVDQRHGEIDHREAERSVRQRVDDAFLDGGNIIARHDAAGDLLLEGKARAARQRLDVEHDVAVLAVAARLLLVAAALDDAFADGLAVADARLAPLDGDAEAVAQPLGGDAQVHFALAPQHHFVGFRIVLDGDRRIFLGELVQGLAELDVVLALLRRDGNGEHRRIGLDLGERGMGLLAGRERVAGLGLVELGEGDGLADRGRAALLGGLADELEHAGDAAGLVVTGQQRRAVAGLAGNHPRDRHLAAVGRVQRLQHIGDGVAAGFHAEAFRGFHDARRFVAQRLHQPQHAVGARRRAHQHRADQPFAQFAGEIVEHLVARRLDVFEQLLHQLVVVIGQGLQHGEARGLFQIGGVAFERHDFGRRVLLVDKGAFEGEIDEA